MNAVFTRKFILNLVCLIILTGISSKSFAQTFDPCGPNGPGCSSGPAVAVFTPSDSFYIAQPAMIIAGALDAQGKVDTTYNNSGSMTLVSGPGNVSGTMTGSFVRGIIIFDSIFVSTTGNYVFEFTSGSLSPFTGTKVFDSIPRNGGGGGNNGNGCFGAGPSIAVHFENVPGTLNANSPSNFQVSAFNGGGCTDTTFTGNITITKLNGPGNISGNTSSNANHGAAYFSIQFDQPGTYQLLATSTSLVSDTSMMITVNAGGGGGGGGSGAGCPPTSTQGTRTNLGLYGGSSLDLTWNYSNKRLFAAISSPASLFYTDDTCKTWHRAFPDDSLEYGCGHGWGGRAVRVLSNQNNWVAVQTSQEAGTLNALVISYDGGTTWSTAMDGGYMNSIGLNSSNVSGMTLSDYYMFCLMGKYIIRVTNGHDIQPSDITNIATAIGGISSNSQVKAMAVANTPDGYPYYIIVDTTGQFGSNPGMLYKYDGTSFTQVTLPVGMTGATNIFTHPAQTTADTLVLIGGSMSGSVTYTSTDGGTTWNSVSTPMPNLTISDVDYSPSWVSSMPSSNGMVMIVPGSCMSTDLGATWTTIGLQNNGGALHPDDPNVVVGTMGRGVVVSTSGAAGPYAIAPNYGLEAVTIKKISRTPSKGVFYLATRAGLAYTTAYTDTTVAGFDKWNGVYGSFPVANVGDDAGISAVAIDPSDSLHVIAGYSNGFALTTTGVSGFSNINPAGYNAAGSDPAVNDILFVSSSVVLAVTGGDNNSASGKGNIWRSTDGGATWTKVSPIGFSCGNSLAKGSISGSNLIYAGTGLSGSMADPGTLWKSTDDGQTWSVVNYGPTATNNPSVSNLPIYDIAVDPRGTDTLYLACGSNLDYAFVRSTDGGTSYHSINAGGEGAFTTVCINQTYPDSVYTAIRRDILVYDAVSDSAMYIYRGLPGELVPDLAYGSVLAGTSMGFFKVTPEALLPTVISSPKSEMENDVMIYPNPVREEATVGFQMNHGNSAVLRVSDILGHNLLTSKYQISEKGYHYVKLDIRDLATGTYILNVDKGDGRVSRTFIHISE